ncbi:hypothetical protein AB0F72_12345 [Actinoplanes sp. NPDC023936]|uniref:hypothetical protein n=1 Tax=Actinoplanes sp. NPDC023936 TaxID=3154910 RepID=UPI0033F55066
MRLSELLEEARADAPPSRLHVDDLVAAGRRRVRRRNTGWAIAAVVVVATAIGVPQILTRPAALPAAAPTATPTATGTVEPGKFSFTPAFRGYSAGDYTVGEPTAMSLGWTSARIREGGQEVGLLSVYPPGVERIPEDGATKIDTEPIDGRDAYFLRLKTGGEHLVWKLADGGTGQVGDSGTLSLAQMRKIAEGFAVGGGTPLRTALTAGYIPDGYRLFAASDLRARFVTEAKIEEILARPDREHAPGVVRNLISIELEPVLPGARTESTEKPRCTEDIVACFVLVADGRYSLVVSGQGVQPAELRKIFESVVIADPAKPSTWKAVDEAYPTFVLPELN